MANRQGDVRRQGKQRDLGDKLPRTVYAEIPFAKGYELAEEEVRISLDEFRENYTDASGGPEYALPDSTDDSSNADQTPYGQTAARK